MHVWYDRLFALDGSDVLSAKEGDTLLDLRAAVAKELEKLRVAGDIGSSLDAEVTLYCDGELHKTLCKLDDELRFVLITSEASLENLSARENAFAARIENSDFWIKAVASVHPKCARCWHRRGDVGESTAHPELCSRCISNVEGVGEQRRFA